MAAERTLGALDVGGDEHLDELHRPKLAAAKLGNGLVIGPQRQDSATDVGRKSQLLDDDLFQLLPGQPKVS